MSLIETPEERRARFLRLASEAAQTAAKMPLAAIRLRYLELSETLKTEAEHVLEESHPNGPTAQAGTRLT
ncbi:MAG TPA: hypothetical protein VEU06_11015 [Micropepsaceae bacterium]|nr:hypothetical protein [Micropepsaceae bacterium]